MEHLPHNGCDPAVDAHGGDTPGYSDHKVALAKRLRRIEGQIRGIERMVTNDAYCIDVLTQVSAASKALKSVSVLLLADHLNHCVADAVAHADDGGAAKVDEAMAAIERLIRT